MYFLIADHKMLLTTNHPLHKILVYVITSIFCILIQSEQRLCLAIAKDSPEISTFNVSVQNHKSVRLLCSRGMSFKEGVCQENYRLNNLDILVELANGTRKSVQLNDQLEYTVGSSCKTKKQLYNEKYPSTDMWQLHEVVIIIWGGTLINIMFFLHC